MATPSGGRGFPFPFIPLLLQKIELIRKEKCKALVWDIVIQAFFTAQLCLVDLSAVSVETNFLYVCGGEK